MQRASHEAATDRTCLADMVEGLIADAKKEPIVVEILECDAMANKLRVDSVRETESGNDARLQKSERHLAKSRWTPLVEIEKLRVEL